MDGSGDAPAIPAMATDALALAFVVLAAVLVALHRRGVARVLWRDEDPRTMAVFRIATGLCVLAWAIDLWPLLDYLFSDEGLFLREAARQTLATETFAGVADGSVSTEPAGFLDGAAFVHWLGSHKHSIFYLWDSPTAVRVVWLALLGAATMLVVGWRTTFAKWSTFVLLLTLIDRNTVFLAGEQLIVSCLLVVCCARCDRAYAIDAPPQLEAIPAWPRVLGVISTLPLFFINGLAKTGEGWAEGHTLHFLVSNPDFARFEPVWISPMVSQWLLRPATWVVHAFELLYPLVVIGTIVRWHRHRGATGTISMAARVAWIAMAASAWWAADALLDPDERWRLSGVVVSVGAIAIVVAAIAGPLLSRTMPSLLVSALRWCLGRRVWITLQVAFTGTLIVLTDLGRFVPLALGTAVLFLEGDEIGRVVAKLRRRAPDDRKLAPNPRPAPRFAVAWLLAWCVVGAIVVQRPTAEDGSLRAALERPARKWIAWTHATQMYRMFAPNGPTSVSDMRATMVDDAGTSWHIGDGLATRRPWTFSWGRNKARKSASRIMGREQTAWFRKWHGRWLCRARAIQDGVLPSRVVLFRLTRSLPTPDGEPAGPVSSRMLWEGSCADEVHGQPPPHVRDRHALVLDEPFVPWPRPRAEEWTQRRAAGDVPRWPWVPALVLAPLVVAAIRRRFTSPSPALAPRRGR